MTPRRSAATNDGTALQAARRRKERTYPELLGPRQRAQLVVVALEVGGRWSEETRRCGRTGHTRARNELPLMRKRAEQACRMRWRDMPVQSPLRCWTCSTTMVGKGTHLRRTKLTATIVVRDRHQGELTQYWCAQSILVLMR